MGKLTLDDMNLQGIFFFFQFFRATAPLYGVWNLWDDHLWWSGRPSAASSNVCMVMMFLFCGRLWLGFCRMRSEWLLDVSVYANTFLVSFPALFMSFNNTVMHQFCMCYWRQGTLTWNVLQITYANAITGCYTGSHVTGPSPSDVRWWLSLWLFRSFLPVWHNLIPLHIW